MLTGNPSTLEARAGLRIGYTVRYPPHPPPPKYLSSGQGYVEMAFGQHELRSWLSYMALACLSACDWTTVTTEENESCLDGGDGIIVMAVLIMVSVATIY